MTCGKKQEHASIVLSIFYTRHIRKLRHPQHRHSGPWLSHGSSLLPGSCGQRIVKRKDLCDCVNLRTSMHRAEGNPCGNPAHITRNLVEMHVLYQLLSRWCLLFRWHLGSRQLQADQRSHYSGTRDGDDQRCNRHIWDKYKGRTRIRAQMPK